MSQFNLTKRSNDELILILQAQIVQQLADIATAQREANEAENIATAQRENVRYWLGLFGSYLPQTAIDRLRAILAIPSDQ